MPRRPYYAAGLKFSCTPCGKCCTNHRGYDFVYLTRQDVAALANHFRMKRPDFRKKYTKRIDGHTVLMAKGADCVFLKRNHECKAYQARPLQCRTFPFWKENLTPKRWKSLGIDCPGIGQGPRVSRQEIATYLRWDRQERYEEKSEKKS